MLVVGALVFAVPFLWMLSTALKGDTQVFAQPPTFVPAPPVPGNFVAAWTVAPFTQFFANTLIISGSAVVGSVLTSSLVGFSFARLHWAGRDFWFMVMLSTLMLPAEVTLIPQYIIYQKYFHWINTFWPLIVPSWAGGGAFAIFLMRQFIMSIPRDLDDAARVDGANSFQILWRILMPLCRPALATVAILQFLAQWNDFFGPFIYLNDEHLFTMSVGLRFFQTLPETVGEPKTHLLMAATIIMAAPAILLFFSCQRYFVRGIVLSGIKG